jgi:xanthine dehydrogenase accessory factor
MQKQLQTWLFIKSSLQQNIPIMLLYVVESKGSSPGRQGFFMAVNASGQMQGSIGGGIMEHKFVEMAKNQLAVDAWLLDEASIKKQIHNKAASQNQSGMICSGEQTILLYPIKKEEEAIIQNIVTTLQENRNGLLILSPSGIDFTNTNSQTNFSFSIQAADDWLYKEKLGYKNKLHIIGAGHCALALAELMSKMDFYITLYDDRKNLNTFVENNFVHEKKLVESYNDLQKIIPSGSHQYVVVMTFGYRTDAIAVNALLQNKFAYLGVLGSQKKMQTLLNDFKADGIEETKLNQLHTPIGLPIKSQTPVEIAVSIAAEIIAVKNKLL